MKRVVAGFYFAIVMLGAGLAWTQDISNPQTDASKLTTGALPAGRMPALTGDCTTSAGAVATSCTKTGGVAFTGAATATYVASAAWTPADASGAALTFTGVSAKYTQIGNMVFAYFQLTYPSTVSGAAASINGFPIAAANAGYSQQCTISFSNSATAPVHAILTQNTTTMTIYTGAGAALTNAQMSTTVLNAMCVYPVT